MKQSRELSPLQRAVALHSQEVLGEQAEIYTYASDDGLLELPVLVAPDNPAFGASTFATIGLSDHPQPNYGSMVRLELIGSCDTPVPEFGQMLSSCVFECLKNERPINYGVVFENLLDRYGVSDTMKHVTFVAPFLWDGLTKARLLEHDVLWLLALPISDEERAYIKAHGIDALEKRLEAADVDITDITRASVG